MITLINSIVYEINLICFVDKMDANGMHTGVLFNASMIPFLFLMRVLLLKNKTLRICFALMLIYIFMKGLFL